MYACSLGPGPFRLRGAGGLRNPSRESRPGPEATVLLLAGQVDPRLTEFRPYYDSIDEPVSYCLPPCARCRTRGSASQKVSAKPSCPTRRPEQSLFRDSQVTQSGTREAPMTVVGPGDIEPSQFHGGEANASL